MQLWLQTQQPGLPGVTVAAHTGITAGTERGFVGGQGCAHSIASVQPQEGT